MLENPSLFLLLFEDKDLEDAMATITNGGSEGRFFGGSFGGYSRTSQKLGQVVKEITLPKTN